MSDTQSMPVGDGVVRISWTAETTIDAVRLTVASAIDEGAHRVEAYVDPGDVTAQRAATFSGLRKEGISRGIHAREDRIVYARLASDVPTDQPEGFRALLNSF
ncbi:MAG TPA: GNAT family protein, partial [Marmoricola sp.]